MKTLKRNFF